MTTPQTPENASLQNETSQSETPINETVQSEAVPQSSTPVQQSAVAGSGGTTAASSDMGTATSNPDGASPHKPVAVWGWARRRAASSAAGIAGRVAGDSGLAFVVVMHLSPDHESNLAQVLQTHTEMPVVQATQAVRVEANHVYVIPPNQHIMMEDGHLHLTERQDPNGKRVAIDCSFAPWRRTTGSAPSAPFCRGRIRMASSA
jgi:hypothetical protein